MNDKVKKNQGTPDQEINRRKLHTFKYLECLGYRTIVSQ